MSPGLSIERDHSVRAVRRIAQNTVFLSLADGVGRVMTFVFVMLAAKHLGVERFGVLSFSLAYVAMFAAFADLGLGVVVAREIAKDHSVSKRLTSNALAMKLVAAAVLMAAIWVSVHAIGYPARIVQVTRIASLYVVASTVALFYGAVFQGFERLLWTAVSRLLQTVVLIVGAFVLSRLACGTAAYAYLYVGGVGSGAVLAWVLASVMLVRPGIGFEFRCWRGLLVKSLPVGLAAAFGVLYYWNGTALLSRISGDAATGLYGASFRLVLGLGFMAQGFAGAIYPVMSRLHVAEPQRLAGLILRAFRYVVLLGVGFVALGSFLARPSIALLYGPEFQKSAPVLMILVWWGGFMGLNAVLSNSLYAINRPKSVTLQTLTSLVVNVGLNLILIPRFGALGAAVALSAAEAVGTAFLLTSLARRSLLAGARSLAGNLPRALVAGGSAGMGGFFAARWHPAAGLAVGVVGYLLLLGLLRAFTKEDRRLLKLIFSRGGVH